MCALYKILEIEKNNFLSRALTLILCYHHSWIPSILCIEKLQKLTKYIQADGNNSLISQISHLFGCVRPKNKTMTRVIVYGENRNIIHSLLFILSYFIRSSATITKSFANKQSKNPENSFEEYPHAFSLFNKLSRFNGFEDLDLNYIIDHMYLSPLDPSSKLAKSSTILNPYCNVDRSLFASFCKSYSSDFLLMGISSSQYSYSSLIDNIQFDLQFQCKFFPTSDLFNHPSNCDYNLSSSSCILLNVDSNNCNVYHYQPPSIHSSPFAPLYSNQIPSNTHRNVFIRSLQPSPLIIELINIVKEMWKADVHPDSCILYLEDQLTSLFDMSILISSFYSNATIVNKPNNCTELANLFQLPSVEDAEMLAVLIDQFQYNHSISSILFPASRT